MLLLLLLRRLLPPSRLGLQLQQRLEVAADELERRRLAPVAPVLGHREVLGRSGENDDSKEA